MGTVHDITRNAIDMARYPVIAAIVKATRITAPKADAKRDPSLKAKRGMRMKLSQEEGVRAVRWVSLECEKHGLKTADVLKEAAVAAEPKNYGPFRLTAAELETVKAGGTLDPDRRVCLKIAPYYSIAREIARQLRARDGQEHPEVAAGLGLVLDEYLRPFRDQDLHEDVAERLELMGAFFERTVRGDGVSASLPEIAAFAAREGLAYADAEEDRIFHGCDPTEPKGWETVGGVAARVPLAWRKVGHGRVMAHLDGKDVGTLPARLFETVGVILVPDGPRVSVKLYAEPFMVVRGEPGGPESWMGGALRFADGVPWGTPTSVAGTKWSVSGHGKFDLTCRDFEAHVDETLRDDNTRLPEDVLVERPRVFALTPEALLDLDGLRDADLRHGLRPDRERGPAHRPLALPAFAENPRRGEGDESFLARLLEGLESLAVLNALKEEVLARAKAMEAWLDAEDRRAAEGRKAYYDALRAPA